MLQMGVFMNANTCMSHTPAKSQNLSIIPRFSPALSIQSALPPKQSPFWFSHHRLVLPVFLKLYNGNILCSLLFLASFMQNSVSMNYKNSSCFLFVMAYYSTNIPQSVSTGLVDGHLGVGSFQLLWTELLCTFLYKSFCGYVCSFLLGK